jgi:hypothetical protein
MNDRPKAARILQADADLYGWLVQTFDTARGGYMPLWDSAEPVSGQAAEHEYPSDNSRRGIVAEGTVVFRVSSHQTGWDQLAGLIFELHNFRGATQFEEIHTAAVSGAIDEQTYIRRNIEQEFVAVRATKVFLITNVLPLRGARGKENSLLWALVRSSDTVDEMLRRNEQRGYDPRDHYEMLYNTEVVPEIQTEAATRNGPEHAQSGTERK